MSLRKALHVVDAHVDDFRFSTRIWDDSWATLADSSQLWQIGAAFVDFLFEQRNILALENQKPKKYNL